jgi:hypothetical protein
MTATCSALRLPRFPKRSLSASNSTAFSRRRSRAASGLRQHVDLGCLLGDYTARRCGRIRMPVASDPLRDRREVRHQGERLVDDALVRVVGERRREWNRIGAQHVVGHEEMIEAIASTARTNWRWR